MADSQKSLKSGWQRVKFGDVVRLSKNRSSDPVADGYERYIGLDHIEPEDLRIRRWGNVADGVTFTSVFKPGQVLFGKRRAYQRKVAVADFTGVCSGDIYVFESKNPKVLLPELLPFICQTETFFQHAVGTSAGSLSPRTNWTSLADFQFALPSLKEQRRIADMLEVFNHAKNSLSELVASASNLYLAGLDDFLGISGMGPRALQHTKNINRLPIMPLQDLIDPDRPISYGILQPGKEDPSGIPMLRTMDFDDFGRRVNTEFFCVAESVEKTSISTRLRGGELLMSVMATIGRTFVVPESMATFNVNRALAVIAPDIKMVTASYLEAFFHSRYARITLDADKIGSAQLRINLDQLRKMHLPVPSLEKQEVVVSMKTKLMEALLNAEQRFASLHQLQNTFLNEVFI